MTNDAPSTDSLDAQIGLGNQNYYGSGGEALIAPGTSQTLSEPLPDGSQTVRVIDASTNDVLASETVSVSCSNAPAPTVTATGKCPSDTAGAFSQAAIAVANASPSTTIGFWINDQPPGDYYGGSGASGISTDASGAAAFAVTAGPSSSQAGVPSATFKPNQTYYWQIQYGGGTSIVGGTLTFQGVGCPAPVVTMTAPTEVASLATTERVSWEGSDAGGPGIVSYQVRYTRASYRGAFTDWSYPAAWQSLRTTSLTQTGLEPGNDYCWSVRAVDASGTASAWSAQTCTAIALDDRALSGMRFWTKMRNKRWWNGTATATTRRGARLTRSGAQVDRVGLVATTCPSCGKIEILVGSRRVGIINLHSRSTAYRRVLLLPSFPYSTGTVTLRVLSSRKRVQIDGLVLTRT